VPNWNISSHLSFMSAIGISHTVLGFTGPSANIYFEDRPRTIALARLINEQLAAYKRTYPESFSFFASTPLPWVNEAVKEVKYAMEVLGAVGVALTSNHEGKYLGWSGFEDFWRALDDMASGDNDAGDESEGGNGKMVVYVHPTSPWMKVNETWVAGNPYGSLSTSRMEFYVETARTFMDLTISQTIHNFTNTHFVLPHSTLPYSPPFLTVPCMLWLTLPSLAQLAVHSRS